MSYSQPELDIALKYVKTVKVIAEFDPHDKKIIQFHRDPSIPESLSKEVIELIECCFQFFQRTVFTGEYDLFEENQPKLDFKDIIEELNFKLDHHKDNFIYEVKKSLGLIEEKIETQPDQKIKISRYAQAMLNYHAQTARHKTNTPK